MEIEGLLKELGIEYKIMEDEAFARCPSHFPDRHPSWSVNLKTGVHHCFSCGYGGNLASLVATVLHLSYPQAVLWVNERVGWARVNRWREDVEVTTYAPPAISEADLVFFTDPPQEALDSRKITLEAAKLLGVRWNTEKNAWIFPIRDPYTNDLWGWQEKSERRFRNYPHGVRKSETLFGMAAFEHDSTAILVESPVDAVRLNVIRRGSGLSSYGVHISGTQFSLIHEFASRLICALDNDLAGIRETARIAGVFKQLPVYVFDYGDSVAKDIGDMNDEEIRWGIDNAVPAYTIRWKD